MIVIVVFLTVYAGMFFGRLPGLRLDRTGIALGGALALLVTGSVTAEQARQAVDLPTIALLFGLMLVSAQLRLGGFYAWVAAGLAGLLLSPPRLLVAVVVGVGVLSAIFTNDVICLAMAPVLVRGCRQRGLHPIPFLLALACASNVGSAATLIGNPQVMLIGQALGLSFGGYLRSSGPIALVGLGVTCGVIAWQYRGRWELAPSPASHPLPAPTIPFDRWQTCKGLLITALLLVVFLALPWPRELAALTAAGLVLLSRTVPSRQLLGVVDWQLLVLFGGLFVVNGALLATGIPADLLATLAASGIRVQEPLPLFVTSTLLSNAVSNVPATMLLLPIATHPLAGPILALSSTLAGNLLIIGSIANIIVVEAAAADGIVIDWHCHARVGLPVTLLTLAVAAAGLALLAS